MAFDHHPLTLMNMPLEVRHQIFDYVAIRDAQPEKLLRYWFEKQEVKAKRAELAAKDPNAGAPRVVFEGDQFEHEEHLEEDSEDNEEGEEDSDEDNDEGNEDDSDQDEAEDDNEDDDEEGGVHDDDEVDSDEQDADMDEADVSAMPMFAQAAANAAALVAAQASIAQATAHTSAVVQAPSQDNTGSQDVDVDLTTDDEENHDDLDGTPEEEDAEADGEDGNENGNEHSDGDSDEEITEEGTDADNAAGVAQPSHPAPVITTHRKWRHIPQFMRITHSPPPVELLLTSKQLNVEAKSWFYDIAVLRIEATGSFAHTSFFEEAFSQITESAFSPMEDIRKVEVTFVWDTTWLHSEQAEHAGAIFPALLRQRALFVVGILAQAPNLIEVTIHWHDSAQAEDAVDLMNDVLTGFLSLDAAIKVEPHYIAADAKPSRKSIAGRCRQEFQNIVNNGLDRLF